MCVLARGGIFNAYLGVVDGCVFHHSFMAACLISPLKKKVEKGRFAYSNARVLLLKQPSLPIAYP
jgi:hypothetical protein